MGGFKDQLLPTLEVLLVLKDAPCPCHNPWKNPLVPALELPPVAGDKRSRVSPRFAVNTQR